MAGTIAEDTVREIVARTSLASLIGEHVRLKRAGSRLVGLCPFHGEKTPSFSVNDQNGFYHCFGCGASGDAISFLRDHLGMGFAEAVEHLGERAGIRVERQQGVASKPDERDRKARLYAINAAAADYYHQRLMSAPPPSAVWQYTIGRGLDQTTVRKFQLGWAEDRWDGLGQWLRSKGLDLRDAETVGLLVPRQGGGAYDRFRHRLMFPILDLAGRVVAFGGRALPSENAGGEQPPAKYINSPESPIYRKGDVLFGLAQARTAVRKKGRIVLVEGNLDLITLHRLGVEETVAPLGTALTESQMAVLRRFADRLVLFYDSDRAGRAAALKAVHLASAAGFDCFVASLPPGDDPDSFAQREGAAAVEAKVAQARSALDYLLDALVDEYGTSEDGKARVLTELAPWVGGLKDFRQRDLYVSRIAGALRLAEAQVERLLPAGQKITSLATPSDRRQAPHVAQPSQMVSTPVGPVRGPSKREVELVRWCLQSPGCLELVEEAEAADWLDHPDLRAVLWEAILVFGESGRLDPGALLTRLSGSPLERWVKGVLSTEPEFSAEASRQHVASALGNLREQQRKKAVAALQERLARADKEGDRAGVARLLEELKVLRRGSTTPQL